MNRIFISWVCMLVVALSLPGHALGQSDRRSISTNGYGEIKVEPDMAQLHLSVTVVRKKALEAKGETDQRVNNLIEGLKKTGIKDADITASNLLTSPRYQHSNDLGRQFVGYQASRNVVVMIRDLDQLTDIMDIALVNDIQTIGQIAYRSSAENRHREQARSNAIADSKNKATLLAGAYGAQLGAIHTINYHSNYAAQNNAFIEKSVMADAVRLSSNSVGARGVYKPREIIFSDNIQVVFDLIVSE